MDGYADRRVMKSILVIGTGKFGHHLCEKLIALGNEIMVVDSNEDRISDLFSRVTNARIGDCTDPEVLKSLGVRNFDLVIVCIAENFQNSLEITSLVKEMGAKYVISTASRDIQAKFLLRNGADEVVYPDRDVAVRLASKCSANHVFDYIELTDEYSIYEVPIIDQWVGKSIRDVNVRALYHINIIGIISGDQTIIMPDPNYVFSRGDHIKAISNKKDMDNMLRNIK